MRRSALVLVALAALVALIGLDPASGALPSQAAPAAHDHASHHHGPDGLALDPGNGRKPAAAPAATYDVDLHATWSAGDWVGGTPPTSDLADTVSGKQVHAIYVHPAKTASRFSTFAAMFQADARQANDLLVSTGRRPIRFDLRAGGYLDITSFRSKYRASQLAGSNQFSLVANEIATKFNNPNKKYVVWLDAGSRYCGQGTLYTDARRDPNVNGNNVSRTTGIVYRPYDPTNASTGGFCRGRTLLHELGHNLGAVQPSAPNDFDGAHCDDSAEDVMCYEVQAEARALGEGRSADTGGAVFDHGSDDYWDPTDGPALRWWTVNLSSYLCPTNARC